MKLARLADPAFLRGAWWAGSRHLAIRRRLRKNGMATDPLPPPALPDAAASGVAAVLRRTHPTCLERALLVQAWESRTQPGREVVVGVTAPSTGFKAHAWLDGDPRCHADAEAFHEFTRLPPSPAQGH